MVIYDVRLQDETIFILLSLPCLFMFVEDNDRLGQIDRGLTLIYLLGGTNLGALQILYTIIIRPLYHTNALLLFGFIFAVFIINVFPVYLWCRKQPVPRACLLALIGGISGPCVFFAVGDIKKWLLAMGATPIFYICIGFANIFRKRYLPFIALPPELEWRK